MGATTRRSSAARSGPGISAGRRVSRGALYTTLDRLETKGLLRWKINAGARERAELPRRTYAVTTRGLAVLLIFGGVGLVLVGIGFSAMPS